MNDLLANKIIDDFILGDMTAQEAWRNVRECRDIISDEKFDEISALILEDLIDAEVIDDDDEIELENFFQDDDEDYSWLDQQYENWEYGNITLFDSED
jgi:hypothetical protein